MRGGHIDREIKSGADPLFLNQSFIVGGCTTDQDEITSSYNLKKKFVNQTLGPVWNDVTNGEPKLLVLCFPNSLQIDVLNQIKTIAFPTISTGVFSYANYEGK